MTLYMTFSAVADPDAEPIVAEASLPADDVTLAQLAEEAGLDSIDDPIRTYDLELDDLPKLGPHLEIATLHEANILATRLTLLLRHEIAALEAFAEFQRGINHVYGGDDLINLSYQLESCARLPTVFNAADLGRFIIENDMDSDLIEAPDRVISLIDPKMVGYKWLGTHQGVFTKFGYFEQTEMPENLSHPYVRIVNSLVPSCDDKLISLALTKRQWQIIGDALRTWEAPTTMQDAVDSIRTQLQNGLKEQQPWSETGAVSVPPDGSHHQGISL